VLLGAAGQSVPELVRFEAQLSNPQPYAANIAANAHRYFNPDTRLIGPQLASFPLGAASHYLAATDQQHGAEMETVKGLLRDNSRAHSTAAFLRSMATDPAPLEVKGDSQDIEEHRKMAKKWFEG